MPELGGIIMLMGGGMLTASSFAFSRARPRVSSAELAASLAETPVPAPDLELDDLMARAAAALDAVG